jgi:hypothetical protein
MTRLITCCPAESWGLAPTPDGSFQAKGAGDAPVIIVSCLRAQVSACPSGSRVAFALEGGHDQGGFLTAYADPIAAGERVWLLTNEPWVRRWVTRRRG